MSVRSRIFSAAVALCVMTLARVASAGSTSASATKIGNPTWEPVGFVLFSAPIGTQASGFAEFLQSAHTALPSPNYEINPNTGGVVPVPAHAGPYNNEFVDGVNNSGFKQGPDFEESDFSGANGIFVGFMLVPTADAPEGSSPDFASGPIIPNSLFDISFSGAFLRNGSVFDNAFDGTIFKTDKNLDGLVPPGTTFDGYSHYAQFFATGAVFGPNLKSVAGSFTTSFTLKDQLGNGYEISDAFTIHPAAVPLPPAVLTSLPALAGLWGLRAARRARVS